ncbi:hypothetical protein AOC36_09280 [Erysipelothrix larvae]|uniref:DUF5050 domain-containing protein n=1 Tax=Erysipelothrix larvae TaxID=1514105 RepID=A0A0X8H1C7_9FIRM|nr:hypothetical protein [Erysipelothrix larvae]AMC94174.1 hypothetical protein AOC36_09280 [Erysipelothrix larvae]
MKIKTSVLVAFLLLTGCSKTEEKPIDPTIWGYDYNINQLSGSFAAMRSATESEEGIYFEILNTDFVQINNTFMLGYVDKKTNQFSIVDASGDAKCSFQSPESCTSFSETDYYQLNYYNGYLYYVSDSVNDAGIISEVLMQMDLDGNNRRQVAVLSERKPDESSFTMIYHRGYVYYTYGGTKVNRIDMSDWSLEEIEGGTGLRLISASGNEVFLNATTFTDEDKTSSNAIISLNTEDNQLSLIDENLSPYQKENDKYVTYVEATNSMNLYNSSIKETVYIKPATGSVIMQKDYFVIGNLADEPEDIFLYDIEGNILSTYTEKEDLRLVGFVQIVADDYYYAYRYGQDYMEFIRIPIQNNTFGEAEIIASWPWGLLSH